MSASTAFPKSWRAILPIHPAANRFPLMSETDPAALKDLSDDIMAHGLQTPITVLSERNATGGWSYSLLDGRNRLDAIELAGVNLIAAKRSPGLARRRRYGNDCGLDLHLGIPENLTESAINCTFVDDPVAFVVSANIHRRHLDAETKRKLIANLLKVQPEKSNRQIAEMLDSTHPTVAKIRREEEATGKILPVDKTIGADGKARKQPAKRSAKPETATKQDDDQAVVTVSDVTTPTQGRSWRVRARDEAGGEWSNGVRCASVAEASRYLTHHAVPILWKEATLTELCVVPSGDDSNVQFERNKKGQLSRLLFEDGYCYLFGWERAPLKAAP